MSAERLVGVDIGGTKIAAALVGTDGRLLHSVVRPTPVVEGRVAVLDAVAAAVGELPADRPVHGVGVGTGGVIDRRNGVVVSANELLPQWAGTDLAGELRRRLGLPIAVDNDANAFALAEQYFGAGAGYPSVLYVSVGTGIGGGIVLGGQLLRGAHWTAGEVGHIRVPEAAGRRCNCGGVGHLEAIASGPAMSARSHELTGTFRTVPQLVTDASQGDEVAAQVLDEGAGALGKALAGLVNTIDVERVVVGGGVAEIGRTHWMPMVKAFAEELMPGPSEVEPVRAALGPRSAVIGAAALLLEN